MPRFNDQGIFFDYPAPFSLRQVISTLCRHSTVGLKRFVNFVLLQNQVMTNTFSTSLRRLIIYMIPFGILFAHGNAYGQKEWTLKECVDYAVQNNLSIKQQYLNTELSSIKQFQSKMALAPTLNGSAGSSYNWGRSLDPFSYQFTNEEVRSTNLSLNGNVTLFNGFQLQNSLKQSKLDYLASQSDLKKIQNDISLNVVSAYLQSLFGKEQLKVFANRVNESSKQRDRTRIFVEAGTMTRGNLLDAEAQLANEELNKVTAENEYATASLNLIQLLQLDSTPDFKIQDPKPELPPMEILSQSPEQIYQAALKHLPEVKSVEMKVASAEKGLAIANGELYPRLSMYGSYSTGFSSATISPSTFERTPYKDQLDNNLTKSLGISLSIPIFNGWSAQSNVSRSRINMMNATLSADITRQQVYKSIQQAYTDAKSAQKKYDATLKSSEALEEAYQYAEKRFNAGISSSLEFLTATNNLTKAKTELLQAKYDFIFKVKVLDFYAGNPLTF
jgi:outer membrane protein